MRDEIEKGKLIQEQSRKAGENFLQTELETSLTFARQALSAGDNAEKRERGRANARKGYDTLLRLRPKFPIPLSEEQDFSARLEVLKSALRNLGETDV